MPVRTRMAIYHGGKDECMLKTTISILKTDDLVYRVSL